MGDVIAGRFELIDPIARGGSGAVWRAVDRKTGQVCAAKVLRQRDSADLMRFVREKSVTFDHPNLLTPYGWAAEDEHVVIAMPLAAGGTLESLLRRDGALGEAAITVIMQQLLKGLGHMHEERWIHRDVKPANIMFATVDSERIHARLSDFGIAVHESDVRFTSAGVLNGTPGYMAPELFHFADPAPTQDLYAAGVVALICWTGPMKLKDGAFSAQVLDKHLDGMDPRLQSVIRTLLAPDTRDRYANADAALADLPYVGPTTPLLHRDGRPIAITEQIATWAPTPSESSAFSSADTPPPFSPGAAAAAAKGQSLVSAQQEVSPSSAPRSATPTGWRQPMGTPSPWAPPGQGSSIAGVGDATGESRAPRGPLALGITSGAIAGAVAGGLTLWGIASMLG